MARKCLICGKGTNIVVKRVKLRGKYNPTTKQKQSPNLQWVKIPSKVKRVFLKKFAGKKILACTQCIKTIFKKESIGL